MRRVQRLRKAQLRWKDPHEIPQRHRERLVQESSRLEQLYQVRLHPPDHSMARCGHTGTCHQMSTIRVLETGRRSCCESVAPPQRVKTLREGSKLKQLFQARLNLLQLKALSGNSGTCRQMSTIRVLETGRVVYCELASPPQRVASQETMVWETSALYHQG